MATNLEVPAGFDEATSEQRIALVQELWDRIAANPKQVPVPAEHRRVLAERLAEYEAHPTPGRPWSEVREQLLSKYRST
jgi:putative addiction module component (TIGR02574 family)